MRKPSNPVGQKPSEESREKIQVEINKKIGESLQRKPEKA
jgi:hypothetical protein